MNKEQVQEALGRIDNALAQLNINRQGHIILTNDLQLVSRCCADKFDGTIEAEVIPEKKNVRTNLKTKRPTTGNPDSKGSGDSV